MLMPTLNEKTHIYTMPDGRIVPGLTQILREAGIIDTAFYTEEARERGTAVHKMIEQYHSSKARCYNWDRSPYYPYFQAFLEFRKHIQLRPRKLPIVEQVMYCATQDYACKIDLLYYWADGICSLLEIKTGTRPPWVDMQLAAQQQACFESGLRPTRLYSLELRGDGTFDFKEHRAHPAFENFLKARKACSPATPPSCASAKTKK